MHALGEFTPDTCPLLTQLPDHAFTCSDAQNGVDPAQYTYIGSTLPRMRVTVFKIVKTVFITTPCFDVGLPRATKSQLAWLIAWNHNGIIQRDALFGGNQLWGRGGGFRARDT